MALGIVIDIRMLAMINIAVQLVLLAFVLERCISHGEDAWYATARSNEGRCLSKSLRY